MPTMSDAALGTSYITQFRSYYFLPFCRWENWTLERWSNSPSTVVLGRCWFKHRSAWTQSLRATTLNGSLLKWTRVCSQLRNTFQTRKQRGGLVSYAMHSRKSVTQIDSSIGHCSSGLDSELRDAEYFRKSGAAGERASVLPWLVPVAKATETNTKWGSQAFSVRHWTDWWEPDTYGFTDKHVWT